MKKKQLLILAIGLSLMFCRPIFGGWYKENVEKGADTIMMEIRYPYWAESTYNAYWNFGCLKTPVSGYAGMAMGIDSQRPSFKPNLDPAVQDAYRPQSVWAFWGKGTDGEPVRVIYSAPFNYPRQYIGEGASCAMHGAVWPIKRKQWYRPVIKLWRPTDKSKNTTYMGYWIKDITENRWHLYGVVEIPYVTTGFNGNSGFLEDANNNDRSTRSVHRRLGYYKINGQWKSSDTVIYRVPPRRVNWAVKKLEDDTVLAMEASASKHLIPQTLKGAEVLQAGKTYNIKVKQPATPTFDALQVSELKFIKTDQQILVEWKFAAGSSPQLGYKIEVFDNKKCAGAPLLVKESMRPDIHQVLFHSDVKTPTIRLTVTDVFDQTTQVTNAQPAAIPFLKSNLKKKATKFSQGIGYDFFQAKKLYHKNILYPNEPKLKNAKKETHFWIGLDEVTESRKVRSGFASKISLGLTGKVDRGFAFKYSGYIKVPQEGVYLFRMKHAGGFKISLDNHEILKWDGLHGPTEKIVAVRLKKQHYAFQLATFNDRHVPLLDLKWEGPGFSSQEIKSESLFFDKRLDDTPTVTVKTEQVTPEKFSIRISAKANANFDVKQARIKKIELFSDALKIAETTNDSLTYQHILPHGKNKIWVRTHYGANKTIDSKSTELVSRLGKITQWKKASGGETNVEHNLVQEDASTFHFIGEGDYVIYKEMTGDFTLTCKVDKVFGRNREEVHPGSWVGLIACERPQGIGRRGRTFSLKHIAKGGLRTSAEWLDAGASHRSTQKMPQDHQWLRIVRKGKQWTAWTSKDGKAWHCGAIHYKQIKKEVGVGFHVVALPQYAQTYFQASISNLALKSGIPDDFVLPAVTPVRNSDKIDLTGITVAPSNPKIILARSRTRGVLKSIDGGKNWEKANGSLAGSANAVRSLAIHPKDPKFILRASGSGKESALHLSKDGATTWSTVDFPGDFDGVGASALCGEVIAFDPIHPENIVIGTETKGLFYSENMGETWKKVAPAQQRFTAVKFHPTDFGRKGETFAHAVTCSDKQLKLLGESKSRVSAAVSRDYVSRTNGKRFVLASENNEFGFLNFTFSDTRNPTIQYGTTLGMFHTFTSGKEIYLFFSGINLESFRPITGIASGKLKDWKWPRLYVRPLAPQEKGKLSVASYLRYPRFKWENYSSATNEKGVVAISPYEVTRRGNQDKWWILQTDGLYLYDLDKPKNSQLRMVFE